MDESQRPKKKSNIFGDSKLNKKKVVFDENWFTFNLVGGPVHSELLVATATIKVGEKAGQPLPLECKWFNINPQNELKEIEGVSGGFYQPCVDDVGSKIYVQATPMIGTEEYQGMPVFSEVGPLVIDKEIENKARNLLDSGLAELVAYLISINFTVANDVTLPCEVLLKVTIDGIQFLELGSKKLLIFIPLGESYPLVVINKLSNSLYEIHTHPDEFIQLNAKDNIERDIIAVAIRMFCGRKILLGHSDSSVEKASRDSGGKDKEGSNSNKANSEELQAEKSANAEEHKESLGLQEEILDDKGIEVKKLDFGEDAINRDVNSERNEEKIFENKIAGEIFEVLEAENKHEILPQSTDIIVGEVIRIDSESNASESNNAANEGKEAFYAGAAEEEKEIASFSGENVVNIIKKAEPEIKQEEIQLRAVENIAEPLEEPGKGLEEPAKGFEEPAEPIKTFDEGFEEPGEPVKTFEEPGEPIKSFKEPAKALEEPVESSEERAQGFEEPAVCFEEPSKKLEETESSSRQPGGSESKTGSGLPDNKEETLAICNEEKKEDQPESKIVDEIESKPRPAKSEAIIGQVGPQVSAAVTHDTSRAKIETPKHQFSPATPKSNERAIETENAGAGGISTEVTTAKAQGQEQVAAAQQSVESKETAKPSAGDKKKERRKEEPAKSEHNIAASYDILMKIEQLTRDNKISLKEKENLTKELSREREMRIKWEKKYNEEKDEFEKCRSSYAKLNKENEVLASKNEEFVKEKVFYLQELNLFRAQIKEREDQIAELEARILEASSKVKNQANMTVEEVEQLQDSLKSANEDRVNLRNENKVLKDQLEKKLETVSELTLENENLENKFNHLKKKHESLVQETQRSLPGNKKITAQELKKNFFNQLQQQEEKQSPSGVEWTRINITSNTKIEDLRVYILKLESTVESLKQELSLKEKRSNYDNVLGFISNFTETLTQGSSANANQQIQYLQKLANTLTETIADREISIENHRKINKELMKKLNEMETKLKIQEELEKLNQKPEERSEGEAIENK